MNSTSLALHRAEARLLERMERLGTRLDAGDESALPAYCQALAALAAIAPLTVPGADGRLLTTKELASAMAVSPRTVLRKRKRGELQAVQLGQRGRAALRWRRDGVAR